MSSSMEEEDGGGGRPAYGRRGEPGGPPVVVSVWWSLFSQRFVVVVVIGIETLPRVFVWADAADAAADAVKVKGPGARGRSTRHHSDCDPFPKKGGGGREGGRR